MPGQSFQVPTFREKRTSAGQYLTTRSANNLKEEDPFLYFSDNARRMAYITGSNKAHHYSSFDTATVERTSRVSFELHPSVVMEDILLDMLDEDDNMDDEDCLLDDLLLELVGREEEDRHQEQITRQ